MTTPSKLRFYRMSRGGGSPDEIEAVPDDVDAPPPRCLPRSGESVNVGGEWHDVIDVQHDYDRGEICILVKRT